MKRRSFLKLTGGAVAAYKVQRRLRPDGPWSDVGLAVESEITLTGQEHGKEWEYCACLPRRWLEQEMHGCVWSWRRQVIAVNKAVEGEPSNTIMDVL